ncbi:MAG TPA: LLM class F420-dependent oxidoreductase [Acidimicrobiales bacterium]|nr:LLM class F420-dependent oxidoreductase [Acidimicrobiales bacterium]
MRISMQVPYASGFREAADRVVELEKAGLDIVWVGEAYGFDAPTLMGYLAARTERVQIGSGILPIYSRTPALLAQTAAGLDHVSNGRAILGLGASGPQVIEGWHGVPYDRPLQRTREIIDICRRAWRREVLTNDGLYPLPLPEGKGTGLGKPLKMITHPVRASIPIYVASLGPKNVELTAEVADGWMPILFVPERAPEVWGEALAKGRANRSSELAPLEVVAGGPLAVGEGLEHLRDGARPMVALYVGGMGARGQNFYNDLARRYGYEAEAGTIQDLYLSGKKQEAAEAVPTDLLEKTSLIGPEGYVRERIAALAEAGVTVLSVTPLGRDPVRLVERLRAWVDDL